MYIDVKVIPNAKKNTIKEVNGMIKVYTIAPAVDGKANKALIGLISSYFNIKKSRIAIIKGLKSRYKTVTISD